MSKSNDGILNDESFHLRQRALYVEPLNYPFDPTKFPADGHEFIHSVRIEAEKTFPGQIAFYESVPAFEVRAPIQDDVIDKLKIPTLSKWKAQEAKFFSRLANRLKVKRAELMEKFPCGKLPSVENEKEFCLFSLGSNLYSKIYMDDKVDETIGHSPLLSIVLHFSQEEIFTLLNYTTVWVMQTDFDHAVCRWIYALFACLEKPVSDECEEFLENFYDFCICRSEVCNQSEKNQIFLLSAILQDYFCVKAYTLGPSLDSFIK